MKARLLSVLISYAISDHDLKAIKELIDISFDEKLEEHGLLELAKKVDKLPTKDEFFSKMDELIGEVRDSRDEQVVLSSQVSVA